jgi:hypothetical protein
MPQGLEQVLFDATLSTVLFSSLVMLAMLSCRQPARRILIARVALLASLAMIPLVALAPLPRFDLVDLFVESDLIPARLFRATVPLESPPTAPARSADVARADQLPPASVPGPGHWLRRGVAWLDLVCVGAGLAWLLLGFSGARWLIRRSHQPSSRTRRMFEELIASGPSAAPRAGLRVSPRVQHPVVVGLPVPTILIPAELDQPEGDREALRLSLLHEIAHVEQSDHWFGMAASLAQSVWFFLPQVWWLRSQLLIDQEFLADRSAAARYGSSFGYASSLLAMAARATSTLEGRGRDAEPNWPATGKIGIASPLVQRLLMLLHCPFPVEARTPRLWSWISRITLIASFFVTACLFVRWPDAGAFAQRSRPTSPSTSEPFRVTTLVVEPYVVTPGGRSIPYVIPLILRPDFRLSVEILANPGGLVPIRIAGYLLGDPSSPPAATAPPRPAGSAPAPSWHRVRIRRDRHGVAVEVDGRARPISSAADPPSDWLTVEPAAHEPVELRNLEVSW